MHAKALLLALGLTACFSEAAVYAKAPAPIAHVDPPAGPPTMIVPDVAERAVRSVVNISTTRRAPEQAAGPFSSDPFLREFFGPRAPGGTTDRRASSLGSGVIVAEEGVVLTNR